MLFTALIVHLFLSTPSARRATGACHCGVSEQPYFYPRPPRGGRPASAPVLPATCGISIHALREEGDLASKHFPLLHTKISIHALREEGDNARMVRPSHSPISIHALREEGDLDIS